jgi:hypothetical protein
VIKLSDLQSITSGLKQESLDKYDEMTDSYDNKGKGASDSSSLRFTDTRGPSSTSHDLLISKTILGNEKERLTESNFLNLLSKSEDQRMPMSTVDNKLKEKKKSEDIGKIAITIKFVYIISVIGSLPAPPSGPPPLGLPQQQPSSGAKMPTSVFSELCVM